jgi:hypothetical protein
MIHLILIGDSGFVREPIGLTKPPNRVLCLPLFDSLAWPPTMSRQLHVPQAARNQYDEYPELNFGPGNKWIRSLTKDRTGQFIGGRYSSLNLTAVLFTDRKDDEDHVQLQVWSAPGNSKPSFDEAMKQEFKPAKKGDSFGPSCTW